MIGTQEHAEQALAIHAENMVGTEVGGDWKYLSCGSYRYAYLHRPTNVLYKVGDDDCNVIEVAYIAAMHGVEMPDYWRLPLADLFVVGDRTVVAMEFITGNISSRLGEFWDRERLEREFAFADMYGDNVLVDSYGFLVPVDLGNCGWSETDWRVSMREILDNLI